MTVDSEQCPGCQAELPAQGTATCCPHCGYTLRTWDSPTFDGPTLQNDQMRLPSLPLDDRLVGTRLGNYDLEAYLGAGAMARVYRARHRTLHRPCAIKVLNPDLVSRSPEVIPAFLAEARAAAGLVHPHVVTIHTIGEDAGLHFIEMEYIHGRSLSHVAEATELDVTRATKFLTHISAALAEAHRLDLVHRDIKPGNVLVTSSDVAKLADFGLAKRIVEEDADASGRQGLAGTPQYMAPELFRGQPASRRSDIYALGVTYFLLCTRQLPFSSTSLPLLARMHAEDALPEIEPLCPHATPEVTHIIRRCLSKEPAERYSDAQQLYDDLHAAYVGLRSLESILREALLGCPVEITGHAHRFHVRVKLDDGRTQAVVVESCHGDAVVDQLVRVFSICAPLDETYLRHALELNAAIPYGSIAIEEIDGQPHFVMVHAHPRSTCDPGELRASVLSIARHADEVEHALTGDDEH